MPKALNKKQKANHLPLHRGLGGLSLLAFSASCVPAGSAESPMVAAMLAPAEITQAPPPVSPPAPEALPVQAVPVDKAMALNAAIPVSEAYNPAARAFLLRTRSYADRLRSLECLTAAVYYEAASESDDGQRAVAQVVLNRVRHPTYPSSVCGVVFQGSERSTGCQFSFTCDGSMARTPSIAGWSRARRIAAEALAGKVFGPVGLSTHYHTHAVFPHWASSLVKSAVIGAHIFYRWSGGWGTPAAFRQAYAGVEPMPSPNPKTELLAAVPFLQPELTTIAEVGRPAEPRLRAVPAPAALPLASEVTGGAELPDSQVREEYRYSGMPLDQVPAAAR